MSIFSGTDIQDQLDRECSHIDEATRRYRHAYRSAISRRAVARLRPSERMMLYWYEPLRRAIHEEQRNVKAGKPGVSRSRYGPPLIALTPSKLAVITMHEAVTATADSEDGATWTRACFAVGRAVFAEINMVEIKREHRLVTDRRTRNRRDRNEFEERWMLSMTALERLHRAVARNRSVAVNRIAWKELNAERYSRGVTVSLGAVLLWLLVGVAGAGGETFQPAFRRTCSRGRKGRTAARIMMTEELQQRLDWDHAALAPRRPVYGPMIINPMRIGPECHTPYLSLPCPVFIQSTKRQRELAAESDMSVTYSALNAMNGVPLTVNRRVLDTVRQMLAAGVSFRADVPAMTDAEMPAKIDSDDPERVKRNKHERKETWRRNVRLRGERSLFYSIMSQAESVEDRDRFWITHSIDYRGRFYPRTRLNVHESYLGRGLIMFADPAPIDDRWLKIHAAGMLGYDKDRLDTRESIAENFMDDMLRTARDPLSMLDFWAYESDGKPRKEAFQVLAACFAFDDPSIAARLSVSVDGSCNGIQHYAAMMRSKDEAGLVNMLPADGPLDVYSVIADESLGAVREMGRFDLEPYCVRKIAKPPVMTKVYGVTRYGMRGGLRAALKSDFGLDTKSSADIAWLLADIIDGAARARLPMVSAAMDWLKEIAGVVIRAPKGAKPSRFMAWTTPTGMIAEQPHARHRVKRVETVVHSLRVGCYNELGTPRVSKQISAFAPNYVHSVDKSHMETAHIQCARDGVPMLGIHDEFRARSGDMNRLRETLTDTFIDLHSRDLLGELRDELASRFDAPIPAPPERGRLDLRTLKGAEYMWS